jgi:outer membrane protein OmpA-like peptidoglycan-associated protein
MKKEILAIVAFGLVAAPVWADNGNRTSKHEAAGVGGGLAVGAAVAGPIGAIVGAALGGWFGDRFHGEKVAHAEAQANYELARTDIDSLRATLGASEQRIAQMESQLRAEEQQYRAALQQALNDEVFFRTGESELHEDSKARLGRIAQLVGSMDGFVLVLAGHADARGAEDYNAQLSAERAAAVRDALVEAGFPVARISVRAEGENFARASEQDVDALALERRVQIELVSTSDRTRVAQQ